MPDDRRQEFPSPKSREPSPFPREAYVFGWLVICVVVAEGVYNLATGVLGTGIVLLCLVPLMLWMMLIRPRRRRK